MAFPRTAEAPGTAAFRPPPRGEVTLRAGTDEFIERLRRRVADAAAHAPTDPERFVEWFRGLKESGPGQRDPLFAFLAERASLFELRWFLNQEMGGEHAARLDEVARGLGLHGEGAVREARILQRLATVLRDDPRYAFQGAGAIAVTALTAPDRAAAIQRAVQRLGLPGDVRPACLAASAVEGLVPLVRARPEHTRAVAEGALMRLHAGARCYQRYRRELGFVESFERRVMFVAEGHDQDAPIPWALTRSVHLILK